MTYQIDLKWLDFPVNLAAVQVAIKALAPSSCGLSADYDLSVICTEAPSDDEIAAVKSYWESLTSESEEATSYKTADQIKADAASAKASALASASTKFEALGLSTDEIAAILG